MYIRIATIKFTSQEKADSFITMMKSVWFEKLDKDTLNLEQIQVKTGEGKIVGFGTYNSKEEFLKTSKDFKTMWMSFIKSFDGIVEFHEGEVVAHYKRKIEKQKKFFGHVYLVMQVKYEIYLINIYGFSYNQ